jgi:hypothetical protein
MARVLVACEFSGIVRDAFRKRGHDAWSCDLEPASESQYSQFHLHQDVKGVLDQKWDIIIAHPPCTYLSNSGVCHLHTQEGRWERMNDGCDFFSLFLNLDCEKVCIENPIQHRYARERIRKYDQIIQPYHFGHPESKAICLWLKGLPPLVHTNDVKAYMMTLPKKDRQRNHYMSPGKDRGKLRSIFFTGIADAMAEQWGGQNE